MTTDTEPASAESARRPNDAEPAPATGEPGSATPAEPKPKHKVGTTKFQPKSILEFIEYSYGEAAGKKLDLASKSLSDLEVNPKSADAEMAALRSGATADWQLAVPPRMLVALAEQGATGHIRHWILQLVVAAFAEHPVFGLEVAGQIAFPNVSPEVPAQAVSDAASQITVESLGPNAPSKLTPATREKLRANAVTAYLMFRVLRDRWDLDRFIAEMSSLVWTDPASTRDASAAALLSGTRNGLSQLARHFERLLADRDKQAEEAREWAAQQTRRAAMAEERNRGLTAELEAEQAEVQSLRDQIADLTRQLEAEKNSRIADGSHYADDYEILRTRVMRRLSDQAELLNLGLHALREGDHEVTEEFLDRSLTAIEGEVAHLKGLDGDGQ